MRGKSRLYLVGSGVALAGLLALAGCGKGVMQFGAERDAWRHDAEAACMKSGALTQNASVVQISPIEGPGMCGADFPLKVAALGEGGTAMSYGEQVRPPGSVPSASMPRFPVNDTYYAPPPPPRYGAPPRNLDTQARDLDAPRRDVGAPMRITPGIDDYMMRNGLPAAQPSYPPQPSRYAPPPYEAPRAIAPRYVPPPQDDDQEVDDIPDDAVMPDRRAASPPPRQTYAPAARPLSPSPRYEPPKLGPARPMNVAQVKATVSPPATLACPMVTALDKWVSESVQPAAMRWFRQPVVEIKQISSYACRGMVGGGAHMSEHAFGNALDVAGFTLADGRKILVKTGWNGRPEEAGFLHDVQGAACSVFSTVLAPGYNIYHYDHIHVDLMRRASGRTPCRPTPIAGEVAAARQLQKNKYAHRGGRDVTGSIGSKRVTEAVAGEDGEFEDED